MDATTVVVIIATVLLWAMAMASRTDDGHLARIVEDAS